MIRYPQISFPLKTIKKIVYFLKRERRSGIYERFFSKFEVENLTSATPRICGNVYDEQPAGVSRIVAYGV